VWVGGADGRLSALDAASGKEQFGLALGAPILDAPVPAGDLLLVGTYDGTVHALRHVEGQACPSGPGCTTPSSGGCVVAAGPSDAPARSWADLLWALAVVLIRRRR
jgi:hypothetical protein